MFDDCISKKIFGHVSGMFRLTDCQIPAVPNHRIRLEVPFDYVLYRDSIVTTWFKTALEKLDNSLNLKKEKYVK